MTRIHHRLLAGCLAAAIALPLCACGAGSGGSAGADTATGPSAAVQQDVTTLRAPIAWTKPTALSKPIDLHGKTVWWVPFGDSVASIHAVGVAFAAAVKAAGGAVKVCDGKLNPVDIGQCLTSAGNQGAAAVATYFVDYSMAPNAFDALAAKGVPVLVAGSATVKANTPTLSFLDTTAMTAHIDESVALAGIASAGDAQPSAIAMMLDDSPTSLAGTKAMSTKFTAECPGCPIVNVDYTSANADKLASNAAAALMRNPRANIFLVPNDGMVPAIQQAIKTSGRNVKIVSALGDLDGLQMVKTGSESGDVGLAVTYMGWFTANELFQQLVGDPLSPTPLNVARYFDSSNVGSLELTPSAYNSGSWYGDDSYQAAFEKAWGLG